MKLKILLFSILFSPIFLKAQNLPACDSVYIDCCSYNTTLDYTINIMVSNYSSNLFSYPGFILFTEEMDTIAMETVNYYGIGWDQTHYLEIIHPFDLPFEGIIELHTGFFETQVCTFPILIPDTTLTKINNIETESVKIFPNPANDHLIIIFEEPQDINQLFITDLNGMLVEEFHLSINNSIDISELKAGIYIIQILAEDGSLHRAKFIKN